MNSFNSTQNQVLYNTESPEGGAGQVNGVQEANQKNLAEQGLESRNISEVRAVDTESDKTFDLAGFDTLIEQAAAKGELYNTAPFETDPETGLSLKGKQIEDLKAQLEALEDDESTRSAVATEIETRRSQERVILSTKLKKYQNIRTNINTKIQATINTSNQPNRSIEDFISGNDKLQVKVSELDQEIQKIKKDLDDFDTETSSQVEQAIQNKKTELQQQLTEAQSGYTESGAEANDKKVLLERQLKEQLTDPNQLFSQQNIDQILATYGIKEGLDKLEELQQASDKAREQATHDEIRKDIMSRAYLYNQRPELAEALSTDIQSKLEALRQSNPESDTIKTALSLGGENRLEYLTDSRDSQLQELAFWFANDRTANIDSIVAEHPQFAKYLDKETDRIYTEQQQEIQSGKKYGQKYLGSRMDKARRVEVDNRISTQLERSKNTKVQELQGELASLKFDENGLDYDTQDRAMLSEQEQLRPADIDRFRTELKTALESGQIKFEQGQFSSVENIPEKQQEINKQLETLFNTIQPVLEAAGYPLQSLESLSSIASNIDNNKKEADKKLFGFGKKQAQALESLATEVANTIEKYNTLKADKQKNTEQYDSNSKLTNSLRESYQKLPKSIQNSLSNLENPTLDSINQTINTGVESIQNYQTPSEISEKRQKIEAIESEIAETQAITAPQTSTQS